MNLADKTVLNILAQSSEAALLMASSIVMVRAFSKAEYGTFLQIMLISNTVIMFTFFGLPQSVYYFFQKAANRKNFVLRNVVLSICIGLIAALLVFGLKNQLVNWLNNPLLSQFGWVAPLLIVFRAPSRLRDPMLISHGSLILNSATVLFCHVIFYLPLILAALLSVPLTVLLKIMIIFSGIEFCTYLGTMAWILYHTSSTSGQERDHKESNDSAEEAPKKTVTFKEQLKYAFPIGVSSYLGIVGRQIDQYIVSVFFAAQDFAVYSRGAMRIPLISSFQYTVNAIMMPRYVKAYAAGDIKAFLKDFHTCIEKIAKINFPVFSFLFVVAPSIVTFLYTEEYSGASSILRVYLCLLLQSITVYNIIPRASGQTSCIMYATTMSIVTNVLLSLVLVSQIGPIGAALATVLSTTVVSWYYLSQSCKILHVSFQQIFPWKFLSQVFLSSVAAGIPVYGIEYLFHPKGADFLIVFLIEGLVYCYCYVLFMMRKGLIHQEDMDLLKKWLRFDVQQFLRKITFLS